MSFPHLSMQKNSFNTFVIAAIQTNTFTSQNQLPSLVIKKQWGKESLLEQMGFMILFFVWICAKDNSAQKFYKLTQKYSNNHMLMTWKTNDATLQR